MKRLSLSFGLASLLLASLPAPDARADELPARKTGLWEMKMVRSGSPLPQMIMQQCTDETTDKDMIASVSPLSKENCSRRDVQKTATGYVTDSACSVAGISVISHAEIVGDFNSAYTINSTAHSDRSAAGLPHDVTSTIEAKWLGPCKADQKPGDVVMPGGFKINVKDMQKLKGLLPK